MGLHSTDPLMWRSATEISTFTFIKVKPIIVLQTQPLIARYAFVLRLAINMIHMIAPSGIASFVDTRERSWFFIFCTWLGKKSFSIDLLISMSHILKRRLLNPKRHFSGMESSGKHLLAYYSDGCYLGRMLPGPWLGFTHLLPISFRYILAAVSTLWIIREEVPPGDAGFAGCLGKHMFCICLPSAILLCTYNCIQIFTE